MLVSVYLLSPAKANDFCLIYKNRSFAIIWQSKSKTSNTHHCPSHAYTHTRTLKRVLIWKWTFAMSHIRHDNITVVNINLESLWFQFEFDFLSFALFQLVVLHFVSLLAPFWNIYFVVLKMGFQWENKIGQNMLLCSTSCNNTRTVYGWSLPAQHNKQTHTLANRITIFP